MQKAKIRENGGYAASNVSVASFPIDSNEWTSPPSPQSETTAIASESEKFPTTNIMSPPPATVNGTSEEKYKGKEKEGSPVRKFRGIPQNVQLFEVFWKQVVELIKVCYTSLLISPDLIFILKARPDLSIQDITALFVSLTNLSLSCYPDRLEYVDQILGFAATKIQEFAQRLAMLRIHPHISLML